ncbi:MAG: HutD family protein [Steroidobacteraceae bacterium]
MKIIRQSAFTASPWRNGGGITHEAIRVPAGGDAFRWRISVARIERSGPFSDFASYNRTMVLLQGNGAALKSCNGDQHMLHHVGDTVQFDGALATQCELIDGPCVDLNLMVVKSLHGVRSWVQRLHEPLPLPPTHDRTLVIFPIDAAVVLHAGAGDTATLEPWDLAVISHSTGDTGDLASPVACAAILVFLATLPNS